MSSSERRESPRAASRIAMVLDHETAVLNTNSENISASGAYCTVTRFIPLMTKLQVRLELPGESASKAIRCEGVVVRIDPPHPSGARTRYSVAIFFSDLSERDRSHLAHFVHQRLLPSPSKS